MTAAIFQRRQIERFAQALDDETGDHKRDDVNDTVLLAQRVASDAESFAPEPTAAFRQELRAVLIAAAERQGIGSTAIIHKSKTRPALLRSRRRAQVGRLRSDLRGRRTRAAIIVGLAAGTLAISGISAASGSAVPGDALYGVKRSGEDARLALAGSDRDRGLLYLQFARTRMIEAGSARGADGLSALLGDMDDDTTQAVALLTTAALTGHDTTGLDQLDAFVTSQQQRLTDLGKRSLAFHRVATASVSLLTAISTRVHDVRAAVACGATYTTTDALGPIPGSCPG